MSSPPFICTVSSRGLGHIVGGYELDLKLRGLRSMRRNAEMYPLELDSGWIFDVFLILDIGDMLVCS